MMETLRIQNGQTEKLIAYFVDSDGVGITGETIPMSIWRESDSYWFTGAAWQAGYTTFNMSEQAQGYYYYDFDTDSLSDDVYHIKALCGNADCINPSQAGSLIVGGYVDNIDAAVSSRSSHAAADVWAVSTRELTGFGTLIADIWDYSTRTLSSFDTLISDIWAYGTRTLSSYAGVWTYGTRTLTSFGTLVDDIWAATSRTLTSVGTLVSDIWDNSTRTLTSFGTLASDVWAVGTRTLTSFGTLIADIWSYLTRTLTEGTKDAEIDAIKAKTDNLPADPASEAAVIAEIDANETKIDTIDTVVDSIATKVSRLLGLSHENIYIDNPVYDANGNLTSARVRIYSNKDSVGTESDVIETYTITAVGNGIGKFTTWKQVGTL